MVQGHLAGGRGKVQTQCCQLIAMFAKQPLQTDGQTPHHHHLAPWDGSALFSHPWFPTTNLGSRTHAGAGGISWA